MANTSICFRAEYDVPSGTVTCWLGSYPVTFSTGESLFAWFEKIGKGDRSVLPRPPGKVVDTPWSGEPKTLLQPEIKRYSGKRRLVSYDEIAELLGETNEA